MEKSLTKCLMFGAFMLALTATCAVAASGDSCSFGYRDRVRPTTPIGLPEPATLALLAAGGVGVGLFGLIRRRNRK